VGEGFDLVADLLEGIVAIQTCQDRENDKSRYGRILLGHADDFFDVAFR